MEIKTEAGGAHEYVDYMSYFGEPISLFLFLFFVCLKCHVSRLYILSLCPV